MDVSPRPVIATHCGSGDQNSNNIATDMTADDNSDDGETDIDLSVVGKSLQNQRDEPH